jgi:tetratricopeptide (TPR) repeat protein
MRANGRFKAIATCIGLILAGCGKDSNVNQIFKSSDDDKRFDTLLALGRINYDQGNHDAARKYAEQAYTINPESEKGATLYAYVLLGQVGIDPFSMTKSLITKTSTSSTAATTTTGTTTKLDLAEASTNGAEALTKFSTLINIDEVDIKNMGDYESSDNKYFKDFPIFIPKKPNADGGPRSVNKTLINVVKAIKVICPFVSPDARIDGYDLHDCTSSDSDLKTQAKSHFLWSLAHLAEALAFNSVLLYDGGDGKAAALAEADAPETGVFKRVSALDQTKFSGTEIADYVDAVVELKDNIQAIFDTSSDSMLFSTLSDLTAVSLGFAAMPGIPDSVTKSIKAGLQTIKDLGEKLSSSADSALGAQTEALRLQMNKSVNTKLKKSISVFNNQYSDKDAVKELPAAEQAKIAENMDNLCSQYKDLSGYNSGDDSVELPDGCDK